MLKAEQEESQLIRLKPVILTIIIEAQPDENSFIESGTLSLHPHEDIFRLRYFRSIF